MTIREATPGDAPAIYAAHRSNGENMPWCDTEECREHVAWMIALGTPPIVAELGGEVVAEMEVWWGQDVPELGTSLDVSMIEVHHDHQRQGVGRALIARAIELSREEGLDCVSVWADRRAVGFYEKLGFERRLLLRRFVMPVPTAEQPGTPFRPTRLAGLGRPNGADLQTWRILHPKQKWHDLLWMEGEPPVWKGEAEPRAAIFAAAAGSAIALYRLCHWEGDAETAELYLWSPSRGKAVLTSAIAHAATFGVRTLAIYAYGQVADWLTELGAIQEGAEQILVRPNDRREP